MIELGDNWLAGTDQRMRDTFGIEHHIFCKHDRSPAGGKPVHCGICKRKVPKRIIQKFNFIFPDCPYDTDKGA